MPKTWTLVIGSAYVDRGSYLPRVRIHSREPPMTDRFGRYLGCAKTNGDSKQLEVPVHLIGYSEPKHPSIRKPVAFHALTDSALTDVQFLAKDPIDIS